MDFEVLHPDFYNLPADLVAAHLLGHFLLRRVRDEWLGGPIVETEAYLIGDPASHSFRGETPRTRTMHGLYGHAYVYQIYGYHYCFNTVCRPRGEPEAVLVRAIEPQFGVEAMRLNRPVALDRNLTNGPAKFCQALAIDRTLDGADLCSLTSPVIIARNPDRDQLLRDHGPLVQTTRIGLSVAKEMQLRWYLTGSKWVSRRK